MEAMVHLENITKNYKNICALRDVSLTIGTGITGLLGPNGAGKSTLIKVVMGLVKVTAGHGTVMEYQLGRQGKKIRSSVGYMPEDDCYITGMTGVEMVRFSACLAGMTPIEGLRRSHEILDFCGVHQERYRSVEGYSTGMRQKVKFAAAIVHDPRFLILDEPTSGLDPEEREALLNRVRTLCTKHGKSAIISTHILPDVQSICEHVIILSNGTVKISDRLEQLNAPVEPHYVIQIDQGHDKLMDGLGAHEIPAEQQMDGKILVGISSEADIQAIWAICRERNIVLRTFTATRNSLEEIFMNAIREDSHAHS